MDNAITQQYVHSPKFPHPLSETLPPKNRALSVTSNVERVDRHRDGLGHQTIVICFFRLLPLFLDQAERIPLLFASWNRSHLRILNSTPFCFPFESLYSICLSFRLSCVRPVDFDPLSSPPHPSPPPGTGEEKRRKKKKQQTTEKRIYRVNLTLFPFFTWYYLPWCLLSAAFLFCIRWRIVYALRFLRRSPEIFIARWIKSLSTRDGECMY